MRTRSRGMIGALALLAVAALAIALPQLDGGRLVVDLPARAASPEDGIRPIPAAPLPAAQTTERDPLGIVVNGEAVVSAAPDVAYVTVGVQTDGATAQEALSRNNETLRRVIDAIKAAGIPESDIRTVGLSLSPQTDNQGRPVGYRANNSVRVTVNQIDQVGPVLDAAFGAGANTASNIQFSIRDQRALYAQALSSAVTNARAKADAVASAMSVSIVGVQSMVEISAAAPVPVERTVAAAPAQAAFAPTPIQPGEQQVTARVRVTYTFR